MRLLVDDAFVEEGMAVGVCSRKLVDIGVVEGCSRRNVVEHDGRERFIDMQAGDFSETGKAGDRQIVKGSKRGNLLRVAEAPEDAVVENTADWRWLSLAEFLDGWGKRAGQRLALEQVQAFARYNIAEERYAIICFIYIRDGADEVFAVDIRGESVFLETLHQLVFRPDVEMAFELVEEGNRLALRIFNVLDIPQGRVGAADSERDTCPLRGLRLEDAVAIIVCQADERDDSRVLDRLFTVINVGMGKIHLAASTAADERTGKASRVVKRLQDESFAIRYTVDIDKRERVVDADAERWLETRELLFDGFYAIGNCRRDLARAEIFIGQGNVHDVDLLDHALRK